MREIEKKEAYRDEAEYGNGNKNNQAVNDFKLVHENILKICVKKQP